MNFKILNNDNVKNIFMIGIGGISMSGIAYMLKNFGYKISGSNNVENSMTKLLSVDNINVCIGHCESNITKDIDLVIYTAAISADNPEMVKARELGIPLYERSIVLGEITSLYSKSICVCGTHGKTTTTSMISCCFINDNQDPTVQVGAQLKELNNLNYLVGKSDYMIVESCEYVDSFLDFYPQTIVVTNIELEHIDYFKSIEQTRESFKKFISKLPVNGMLILNKDDENCMIILAEMKSSLDDKKIKIITYSIKDISADFYLKNLKVNDHGFYSFDIINNNQNEIVALDLSVPGIHNVYDSLASFATSKSHNLNTENIAIALNRFTGASRRFEFKKVIGNNVYVYDDYAHHPTEVMATVKAANNMKYNKLWVVFQPHTFSRTKTFINEFVECFKTVDNLILTDIYSAREQNTYKVSSQDILTKAISVGINGICISDFNSIAKYIKDNVQENDLVITVGAGTITNLSDLL